MPTPITTNTLFYGDNAGVGTGHIHQDILWPLPADQISEVIKVQHYWLEVEAMIGPIQMRGAEITDGSGIL